MSRKTAGYLDTLDARVVEMADACTRCGKCVEVCPMPEPLELDAMCRASYDEPATASVNCDIPSVTSDPPLAVTYTGVGSDSVRYTALDDSGNMDS